MELRSKRMLLRPVCVADTADLFRIYGDPQTNQFNPAGPYPDIHYARAAMARWLAHWQTHGFGNWAITLQSNPEHIIGFSGLTMTEFDGRQTLNLGYRFATEAWGQGLATEFSRWALRYGFTHLNHQEITAVVREHHLAPRRVREKVGMHFYGKVNDVENAPASLAFSLTADAWFAALSGTDIP